MSKTRNPDALIRIEDAIKVLCRETCHPGMLCPDKYCAEMWDEFEDVERVDAVPVVRCKDCIRFLTDDDVWGWCTVSGKMRCKDYCSYGVREDGEGRE